MTQYVVALTGGIGSGKSTVASAFYSLGVPLLDSDVIAREVISSESLTLNTIVQHFGPIVLKRDGSLDRAALRACIFNNQTEKNWLEDLLHPLIQRRTKQRLRFIHTPYVLWVTPLLIENNLQRYANRVLVVDIDRESQIKRTIKRDGVSQEQVENILSTQVSRHRRLALAEDVIDNSGHQETIINRVNILHQRYLTLATSVTQKNKLL